MCKCHVIVCSLSGDTAQAALEAEVLPAYAGDVVASGYPHHQDAATFIRTELRAASYHWPVFEQAGAQVSVIIGTSGHLRAEVS